jgi:hypothetical protein
METNACISKKDGTLWMIYRHILIMPNELNKQTTVGGLRDARKKKKAKERKKVMSKIKNYLETLVLTTLWVYAMASLVLVMDIFVWRA